jgi:hypothetical protein
MKISLCTAICAAALVLAADAASADPWKDESGKGQWRGEYRDDYRVDRDAYRGGYRDHYAREYKEKFHQGNCAAASTKKEIKCW